MRYSKLPLGTEDLLSLLKERNLIITDEDRAIRYLENVGYHRLSGYMYHLQMNQSLHLFYEGTTFDDVISHYQFDKKLRSHILSYLERIEVALRTKLTDKYSKLYTFYWYKDESLFHDKNCFLDINDYLLNYLKTPQEQFLKKFKLDYTSERYPPSNMAMELLTFGKLSRLFKSLNNSAEKQEIANEFGLPSNILATWFIYLNNVRNICAHHGRLWNRHITADRPIIPSRKKYQFKGDLPNTFNRSIFGVVSLIERLLQKLNSSCKCDFLIKQ